MATKGQNDQGADITYSCLCVADPLTDKRTPIEMSLSSK